MTPFRQVEMVVTISWKVGLSSALYSQQLFINSKLCGIEHIFDCGSNSYTSVINKVGCRNDTVPRTVDTRRSCEVRLLHALSYLVGPWYGVIPDFCTCFTHFCKPQAWPRHGRPMIASRDSLIAVALALAPEARSDI